MKNICKTLELGFSATIIATLLLTACGGGGGATTSVGATMTVTPSLGKFAPGATVRILNNNGSLLTTATINASGVASITLPAAGATSPLLVEVGVNGDRYFDEKQGLYVTISGVSGAAIRALVPDYKATSQVSVTALTEIAVGGLVNASNVLPVGISVASAVQANADVGNMFFISNQPATFNLLTLLPKLVGSLADISALGTTLEDEYAAKLAGLAHLATGGEDALAVAHRLRRDMNNAVSVSGVITPLTALNNAIVTIPNMPASAQKTAKNELVYLPFIQQIASNILNPFLAFSAASGAQIASAVSSVSGVAAASTVPAIQPVGCGFTFTQLGTLTTGTGSLTASGTGVFVASGVAGTLGFFGLPNYAPISAIGSSHACMNNYAWIDAGNAASGVRQINLTIPQAGAISGVNPALTVMVGNQMLGTTSGISLAAMGVNQVGASKTYTLSNVTVPYFVNPASGTIILNGTLTTP